MHAYLLASLPSQSESGMQNHRPPEWPEEKVQCHRIRSQGGCLFQAVAIGVDLKEKDEWAVRSAAVTYLRSRRDSFARLWNGRDWTGARIRGQTFDDYCARMAAPGAWGGELEIAALSGVFNVRITVILRGRTRGDWLHFQEADAERQVLLWYSASDRHYDALTYLDDQPLPAGTRIKRTWYGGLRGGMD